MLRPCSGEVDHLLGIDGLSQDTVIGFHQGRLTLHFDGLLRSAEFQHRFDVGGAAGLDHHVIENLALKARLGNRKLIPAVSDVGEREHAAGLSDSPLQDVGIDLFQLERGIGNRGSGRVQNGNAYGTGRSGLTVSGRHGGRQ